MLLLPVPMLTIAVAVFADPAELGSANADRRVAAVHEVTSFAMPLSTRRWRSWKTQLSLLNRLTRGYKRHARYKKSARRRWSHV